MSKDAYYFPHDGNARNDDKIVAVRMKYGVEGYGIYFILLEKLRESSDYTCIKDYNVIAFDLRVSSDKIKSIIEDFGLFAFTDDGKRFYSESLTRRMKPLDELREKRSKAGKAGMIKRWESEQSKEADSSVITVLYQTDNNKSKVEESRVKERKVEESRGEVPRAGNFDSGIEVFEIPDLKKYSGEGWLDDIGMKLSIAPEKLKSLYDEFCNEKELGGYGKDVYVNTVGDFRRHFINWLKKQPKEKSSAKKENPAAGKKSRTEELKEIAQRSLDGNS
ncbi:MAG: DUF4373 domain-containing protein [Prevotellaceae bacterium]|jgi:hypothetical protein|nr:DUF4373 domain-containing protein [Prevotellaceae bacterium]